MTKKWCVLHARIMPQQEALPCCARFPLQRALASARCRAFAGRESTRVPALGTCMLGAWQPLGACQWRPGMQALCHVTVGVSVKTWQSCTGKQSTLHN